MTITIRKEVDELSYEEWSFWLDRTTLYLDECEIAALRSRALPAKENKR